MSPLFQLVLFNNCLIQLLIPWMSPLFQLVLFNNCLIQLLISWMSPLFQLVLFNNCLIQLLIPWMHILWMSPLFQLVYSTAYSLDKSLIPTGFIQQLSYSTAYSWMSPLFQLVLFNFLFRWPPLFGHTFYSTTGFIQQLFYSTAYSTFYSDGRPYLVALFIQQLVLFNNCFIELLIQLFIPMAALIWSHFLFNFLFLFNLNGRPSLFLSLLQLINFFSFFFSLEKRCLTWIRSRDLLISSLDAYR